MWPEGFRVTFEPDADLLGPKDAVAAREGHDVQLDQTRRNEATGTWDDPYIADGLTLGGCYSYAR